MIGHFSLLIPIPFCIAAFFTDTISRKIHNYTTYPLFLLGVITCVLQYGVMGLKPLVPLIFIVLMLLYASKARYGGGDIKLMFATGIFIPEAYQFIYLLVVFTAILLVAMGGYACKNSVAQLVEAFKWDGLSGGMMKQEQYRVPAGPVIAIVYCATAWLLVSGGVVI